MTVDILKDSADLTHLFERLEIEAEPKITPSCIRCVCGGLVTLRLPCLCPTCSDPKPYWIQGDGSAVRLAKLGLGRLSLIVQTLGARAERYASEPENLDAIRVALDLVYAEIASQMSRARG